MGKSIKIRLLELGKKQTDLLVEIRKRGYPKLSKTQLCEYINGRIVAPQAQAVLKIIGDILDEWGREE